MAFKFTGLSSLTIPNSVTSIGDDAFSFSSLQNVSIGNGLKSIGNYVFRDCLNLTSVTIPGNITTIGGDSFQNCTSLTNVCFEGNAPIDLGSVFSGDPVSTIYYINGTTGWLTSFENIPTTPCLSCFQPIQTGTVIPPVNLYPSGVATNLALVIHGWTPYWSPTPDGMADLESALEIRKSEEGVSASWDVRFLNWSGLSEQFNSSGNGYVQNSVRNAKNLGDIEANQIISSQQYSNVVLIGHSAGAWMASEIAQKLLANNPNINVSVTFLDAFVPSKFGIRLNSNDNNYNPNVLGAGVPMVEQYYVDNLPFTGLGVVLPQAANYDVAGVQKCADSFVNSLIDSHGWPVRWYKQTIDNPTWEYGYGYGYPKELIITDPKNSNTPLSCPNTYTPPSGSGGRIPPLPLALKANGIATPLDQTSSTNGLLPGTEISFPSLMPLAQGGNGTVSTNADGLQLATTNYVWETFSINTTNDITLGAVDYALTNQCNSVLGMWMDGQPLTFIQSTPQNELASTELFPLSSALGSGNHALTVSLESLDGTPIAATLKGAGFYYAVAAPGISSESVTNGQFSLGWQAGAGLKYQPQSNNDLTSTNWTNLGGLLTSPTNAVMSAFDTISTNSQRFYRVVLQQ
jgi:hypothetical protein